jgi:hypothetical protein
MDGTSLKLSYHKALANADVYYKFAIISILFLILGLFLGSLLVIVPNIVLILVTLPIAIYNQKLSERAMTLYTWKYDADDLFDNTEETEDN